MGIEALSSIALYRKYRGSSFAEIIGQDHITKPLENAIKNQRVSHAYLFTGPRGVGKTSTARLLAHAINGLEYKQEDNHIDIIEIDAASNRRIDEIRDLREKSHIAPVSARYKVYIIDEVHMLTKEAFNALLKTLEEPPAHVVFILATTEAHKVPATIVSRTQKHTFKPMSAVDGVELMAKIAKDEKIKIDKDALELITKQSGGSFRDALGLLDQISSDRSADINKDTTRQILGLPDNATVETLIEATSDGRLKEVISLLREMSDSGIQPTQIASEITDLVRERSDYLGWIDVVAALNEIGASVNAEVSLEIALLRKASTGANNQPVGDVSPIKPKPEPTPATPTPLEDKSPESETEPTPEAPATEEEPGSPSKETPTGEPRKLDKESWNDFMAQLKQENNALAAIFRGADIKLGDNMASVSLRFKFHRTKLESSETRELLSRIMNRVFGGPIELDLNVLEKSKPAADTEARPSQDDPIADKIIETFGGGEKVDI